MAYPAQVARNVHILAARSRPRGDRPTLSALGEEYGVTRERVRQIERRERGRLQGAAPRIAVLGGPGTGKSTQAARLAEILGVPWFSTGELIRGAGARLPRGAGGLADTEATCALLRGAWDGEGGVVIDGFPRAAAQVPAAISLLGCSFIAVTIDLDPGEATTRMRARERAGEADAARRTGRILEAAWRQRDLEAALHQHAVRVVRVDGAGPPDAVTERVLAALRRGEGR